MYIISKKSEIFVSFWNIFILENLFFDKNLRKLGLMDNKKNIFVFGLAHTHTHTHILL